MNAPSTPEPPGLNEAIVKDVKNDIDLNDSVSVPQPRQAVYAGKMPSPPAELNTLVPEDFDLIDFNFKDLKPKKAKEVIKTDNSFVLPDIAEQDELELEEKVPDTKVDTESAVNIKEDKPELKAATVEATSPPIDNEPDSNTETMLAVGAVAATTTAADVATTAILSKDTEKEPEMDDKAQSPIQTAAIIEEPLRKVSEARKSIEAGSLSSKEPESKTVAPIIIAEVPKPKVEDPKPQVSTEHDTPAPVIIDESPKHEEPKLAPIIIAEVPKPKPEVVATEPLIPAKVPVKVEEVKAPPPLPTNTEHLVAVRESLKPSMLPVKPMNGAPTTDPEIPKAISSPLPKSAISSEELDKLNKELERQKLELERETDTRKALESQIQAMISKSNAQDEALRYKNETMEQLNSDFLRVNNDLTAVKTEKEKLEASLAKAQEELMATNESNAQAYLQKSDEINALKDKVAEFASIIGQKNKEIDSLQRQLEEVKRSNMETALENVQQYEKIEDELMKMVEEEILRMQDTIDEQREYNAKMQIEVDSEYAYWKRRLSKSK